MVFRPVILALRLVGVCLLALAISQPSFARWAPLDSAPLQVVRHDKSYLVEDNGTWTLHGVLELRVQSQKGRELLANYRFPFGDENETMSLVRIEVLPPADAANPVVAQPRIVPLSQLIVHEPTREQFERERKLKALPLFQSRKGFLIPFGQLAIGSTARITYTVTASKSRIPNLFAQSISWGLEFPEMSGRVTFESKTPLYFDLSTAAKRDLSFTETKRPDGTSIWLLQLKAAVYRKTENEIGGVLSTLEVPRIQVSNQHSWNAVLETLKPHFKFDALAASKEAQAEIFTAIVEGTRGLPSIAEKINHVTESLPKVIALTPDWQVSGDDSYKVQNLTALAQSRKGDSKDFAFATMALLRLAGLRADVVLVWKESQADRLWIEEKPATPSLGLFNHPIVRVIESVPIAQAPPQPGAAVPATAGGAKYTSRIRYIDPTSSMTYADGLPSDISGSWLLSLGDDQSPIDRVPNESASPSKIAIKQRLELRPDNSIVASGRILVEGPLAIELKRLVLDRGADEMRPYLRNLFGIGMRTETTAPVIEFGATDRRTPRLDLSFSYLAPNIIGAQGAYRQFDLTLPGLAAAPLMANADRATGIVLSKNLSIEAETEVRGAPIADETNTSCLVLAPFASVIREARAKPDGFVATDSILFRTDRILAASMKTQMFADEIKSYQHCLSRRRVTLGPRPAFEKSGLAISEVEASVLKKPVTMVNLQDVKILEEIASPQLRELIQTKIWLATRDMLRRNLRTPQVMLDYATAMLRLGSAEDDRYLIEHVRESAKLFGEVAGPLAKTAKLQRFHADLLTATGRYQEAIVAVRNAAAFEPNKTRDATHMGRIYIKLGDQTNAEAWLLRATTLPGSSSNKTSAIEALANLRLKQGKTAEFISLYERAIRESQPDPWLHLGFASKLAALKMYDLSIEQSRRSLQILRLPDAEALLAAVLMKKVESLYFDASGVVTTDKQKLATAENLAIEALKYSKSHTLAFRVAGHGSFEKALQGDYGSLIAAQAYFAKAVEFGSSDPWIIERVQVANQALATGESVAQLWQALQKNRLPAGGR